MFEGLNPAQARELTKRIRAMVLRECQSFRQEKQVEPLKIGAGKPAGYPRAELPKATR
jgi:hypothetical protein